MQYVQKNLFSKTTYRIEGQSLIIERKRRLGSKFRMEVDLQQLKQTPDEGTIKDDTRTALAGAPGFAIFLFCVLLSNWLYSKSEKLFFPILGVGLVVMVVGFVIGGRVKIYWFKNLGERYIFGVTESGNVPEQFESFVAALREAIRSAQAK